MATELAARSSLPLPPATAAADAGTSDAVRTDARPLLELRNVGASYGPVQILREISCTVHAGECLSVLGVNGAGKTTLLRALVGLMVRRSGAIVFDGADLSSAPSNVIVAKGISLVPEGRHLFAPLSVHDNLDAGSLPLRLAGRHDEAGEARAFVLDLFPRLAERLKQPAGTLSGGEQQMLAIGRALMSRPRLLLLDEPSVGLAPKVIEGLFDVFRRLKQSGMTIVLAEQNVLLALGLADRGVLLHLGRIKLSGSAAELQTTEEIRRIYLGG